MMRRSIISAFGWSVIFSLLSAATFATALLALAGQHILQAVFAAAIAAVLAGLALFEAREWW